MTGKFVEIPSIATRQHRPCNTCSWYDGESDVCNAKINLNYTLMSERTDLFDNTNWAILQALPCRFHMTPDELRMILDPYFME